MCVCVFPHNGSRGNAGVTPQSSKLGGSGHVKVQRSVIMLMVMFRTDLFKQMFNTTKLLSLIPRDQKQRLDLIVPHLSFLYLFYHHFSIFFFTKMGFCLFYFSSFVLYFTGNFKP